MKTKIKNRLSKSSPVVMAVLLLFLVASPVLFIGDAKAATPFTLAFVRLDRLMAATATSGRVCAKAPSNAGSEASVQVTFPTTTGTDYTLATQASGLWTVN